MRLRILHIAPIAHASDSIGMISVYFFRVRDLLMQPIDEMTSIDNLIILGVHVVPSIDFCYPDASGIFEHDNAWILKAYVIRSWIT